MDKLKTFRKAHMNAIIKGETIYADLAKGCGIDPVAALNAMPSMLSSSWVESEHFLSDLGNNDALAIIEARSHFELPLME